MFFKKKDPWTIILTLLVIMAIILLGIFLQLMLSDAVGPRGTPALLVMSELQQVSSATGLSGSFARPQQPAEPPVYPRQNPVYPLRGMSQDFQQLGVLVSKDANQDEPIMLGLFGRKMSHRDRWEYYVASDKFHMWKLPIQQKNRMCDDDVGCEEIYNGDEVVVPDYAGKVFIARIYKYQL